MKIVVLKETDAQEKRVPLVPEVAAKFVKLGADLHVEAGLGASCRYPDAAYQAAGAKVEPERALLLSSADMVLRLRKPSPSEIPSLKKGSIHVSFLDPFNEKELLMGFAEAGISAISLEMIPRSTIAQKMDVLSSQASLGGYAAVLNAASKIDKVFPMMSTPSGTIKPARVFIIGAGVAGLQAIATARRLGAVVEAFDTRPVVEEQVRSLGAKFLQIDLGETGQTKDGYAKQLSPEQLAKQREGMKKACASADVVITTAQVFGKKAPLIITKDMLTQMKPGSVVVDMAVETGGNVEGSKAGEDVDINGVTVIGTVNLPARVARDASLMFSNNLYNLLAHFWNKEQKQFTLNREDDIIKGSLITHGGTVVHDLFKGGVK